MEDRVLLMGEPALRERCREVERVDDPLVVEEIRRLGTVLEAFRASMGFGRGIAAPQIGIPKRFVALNLGAGKFTIINPEITWRSETLFTLWDDCMSFPDLLVKVSRYTSISIRYRDEAGAVREMTHLDRSLSELLQHELDHLDGILAIDRAADPSGIIYRQVYERNRDYFAGQVDYTIRPTL